MWGSARTARTSSVLDPSITQKALLKAHELTNFADIASSRSGKHIYQFIGSSCLTVNLTAQSGTDKSLGTNDSEIVFLENVLYLLDNSSKLHGCFYSNQFPNISIFFLYSVYLFPHKKKG